METIKSFLIGLKFPEMINNTNLCDQYQSFLENSGELNWSSSYANLIK